MGLLSVNEIAEMMEGTVIDGDPCVTIVDYSYNSKEGDSQTLFLPIVGERTDAHDFIADAGHTGMIATVTERGRVEEDTAGMTYIAVDSTKEAIQRLGRKYRHCFDVKCVGITGSVGKTSTKEMVSLALESSFNTIKTEGNKNGQLGVPIMIMRLNDSTQCLVLEMGVSLNGEMERLAAMADPNVAIVTNIGYSHVENFGTRENTRKQKLCIINNMDEKGVLLVNGEDELLSPLADKEAAAGLDLFDETKTALSKIAVKSYGLSDKCNFYAGNLISTEAGSEFDFVYKSGSVHVVLNVAGEHHVLNAVAALATAHVTGADVNAAAKAIALFENTSMRGVTETTKGGILLIDDSYNASPDSMKAGLALLDRAKCEGRKIALLGDMFELGDASEHCHRLVGEYVAETTADVLIAVGKDAEFISEEAEKHKDGLEVYRFENGDEACAFLKDYLKAGDAILCKASRGMNLDKVARFIREGMGEDN